MDDTTLLKVPLIEVRYYDDPKTDEAKHWKYYADATVLLKDLIAMRFPDVDFSQGFYIQPLEREPQEPHWYSGGRKLYIP